MRLPIILSLLVWSSAALALPPGPGIICEVWPDAAPCDAGQPDCTTCHTAPPARNVFGQDVETVIIEALGEPISPETFVVELAGALTLLADEDADGDGWSNAAEIIAGTSPGDPDDAPQTRGPCTGPNINPDWDVCGYDAVYAWRKVHVDVCGISPSWDALQAFEALDDDGQIQGIADALDRCVDSAYWMGRDGALWRLAHSKIRPLEAIKSGRNRGPVPLADYDHDYALFTYTQTDGRDARLALTADFHVDFREPTTYTVGEHGDENLQAARRAGLVTTRWFFVINTMFTPVPRTTAAQAYRAYLGLDIARSEGLIPPDGVELIDYDDKGVLAPTCAACHTTLDPLAYPFTRYRGIAGGVTGIYAANRMRQYGPEEGSRIREVPEAGHLLGEPVADLVEWGRVAADSDAFAQATVRDYWRLMVGHDPLPAERDEFDALWRAFRAEHGYSVERMLHDLVRTEAYGAP